MEKDKLFGGFTLPGEAGSDKLTLEFAEKWGADAIRDSDGTKLSDEILSADYDIYSTICLVRAEQEFPKKHPEYLPEKFLMSEPATAFGETLEIDPLQGYFDRKYKIDDINSPKEWWQVFDRTTGEEVSTGNWEYDGDSGKVMIAGCVPGHVYTVNFLVFQTWDSTSMYNHLTNNWDREPIVSIDPYHEEVRTHLMRYFDKWLEDHKDTTVVRLTTLAYHFTLDSREKGEDKYRDWTGYTDTVSIPALRDFEKKFGYALTSEDFVDEGYYHATNRVPTERWLDWIEFIHDFVVEFGKELVDKVHAAGKKAAIFQGDHWIGVEPFSPKYRDIGIDINIGACECGVSLRRVADSPWKEQREIRMYPYFFSDMRDDGRDPRTESIGEWKKIRRAMLRRPVDRIGYGGYLSIAAEFPGLVENIVRIRKEFSAIAENSKGLPADPIPVKVAILTAWGDRRSWINHTGRNVKFNEKRADIMTIFGPDMLECLSGLPVEVSFISFDEIRENGAPRNVDVIINDGEMGTAWSGGANWADPKVSAAIRVFVASGGGFIGMQEPAAHHLNGAVFQLRDVMGVEKELGLTVFRAPERCEYPESHFIIEDLNEDTAQPDPTFVYPFSSTVKVLRKNGSHVNLAVNEYGEGRSAYLAGLPYSQANSRILLKTILWCAGKEERFRDCLAENVNVDCAVWRSEGKICAANASSGTVETRIWMDGKDFGTVEIPPNEIVWLDF